MTLLEQPFNYCENQGCKRIIEHGKSYCWFCAKDLTKQVLERLHPDERGELLRTLLEEMEK